MPTTPKQIPEITAIPTPTAGQETDIQTVVARESTYDNFKMSLAQIFTLATVSGSIKTALDGLSTLIAGNTSSIASLGTTKLNKVGETRTGLTANRAVIIDEAGVETYLTGTSTQVIGFNGSGKPVAVTPSVDIAGLTQKLNPVGSDQIIISDSEAGGINKRGNISSLIGPLGGNGSDGSFSVSSGTTTIPFSSDGYIEKNYTSFSMTGGTLTFSGPPVNGGVVVIKVSGDFTMTGSSIIDGSGMGAIGGGSAPYANGTGIPGSNGKSFIFFANASNFGGAGAAGGGGAGAAGVSSYGGYNAGYCGGGGGSGYQFNWNTGGGGRGGACIYIEVGGRFIFSAPATIASNGGNGGLGGESSGGGGGGGSIVIKSRIITTNSGTMQVNGGNGGPAPVGLVSPGGGGGGSYASGGNYQSAGSSTAWGTGGTSGTSRGGGGGAGFYKIN